MNKVYQNSLSRAALLVMMLCCSIAAANAQDIHEKYPGYELVWQEEFEGEGKPDEANWTFEKGFVRNHELQYYQEGNASVKNGLLIIEARREEVPNERYEASSEDWRKNQKTAHYTSSSLNTKGKRAFQYGIIEVRAKIDTAKGMWPAIWTLGVDRPWPSNGEVDIMEFYRVDDQPTILANAAWKKEGGQYASNWDEMKIPLTEFLNDDPAWPSRFHIWRMEWTAAYIHLYLDDELLNTIDLARTINPNGFNPFHQPHYVLLNLAIGGNGGDPSETDFPSRYEVDYVRVYQHE